MLSRLRRFRFAAVARLAVLTVWGAGLGLPAAVRADDATSYRLADTGARPAAKLEGTATAFVVAPGLVVTNEHVVRGHNTVVLLDVDTSARSEARVLARDAANDLALLQANVAAKALPVASEPAGLREPVGVIGFPDPLAYGDGRKLAQGWVRELSSADKPELFTLDVSVRGGNSGSPVLSKRGQVVGVVTGSFTSPILVNGVWRQSDPIGAAAKHERLVQFLRANRVPYQSFSFQGSLADIAAAVAPAVFLVEVLKTDTPSQ